MYSDYEHLEIQDFIMKMKLIETILQVIMLLITKTMHLTKNITNSRFTKRKKIQVQVGRFKDDISSYLINKFLSKT